MYWIFFILKRHKGRIWRGWSQTLHRFVPQKRQKEPVTSCENGNSRWIKPNDFARRASWNMAPERLWDVSL